MEFTATGRYLRISPRKARLVVDLVRGMSVESALAQLQNTPKKGARLVEKILKSAIANAEQQDVGDVEQLVVGEVFVNEGPTLRRFRARAMGRATRIRKRTSHVTIKLRD